MVFLVHCNIVPLAVEFSAVQLWLSFSTSNFTVGGHILALCSYVEYSLSSLSCRHVVLILCIFLIFPHTAETLPVQFLVSIIYISAQVDTVGWVVGMSSGFKNLLQLSTQVLFRIFLR